MNEKPTTPSLHRFDASELPVRPLRSPYFIHRTPIRGYYLDAEYNLNLVKSPREKLSLFLADAKRVTTAGDDMGKVTYAAKNNLRPLRYIHEGAVKEFEEAAKSFYAGGTNAAQTSLRENFRLPDPSKEPDAYWVWGDRFAPRLLILWGCEKEQASALPLVGKGRSVVTELRSKAMSWMRLIREGVELSRQDTLASYIAFPVLASDGALTHLDRLVDGKYVREQVHMGRGQSFKARPMKRIAASSVRHYQKLAQEFYRKGHPASDSATLSYEQELRRGFRLPDPDLRPDAYFVTGRPMTGQLLILCPHPGVKDAEEIEQMARDVKWTEDKARTPEDRERARLLHEQYDEDLATHNLYKRYFYAESECLPLVADEVLGLPVKAVKPAAAGAAPVPTPSLPPAQAAAEAPAQTVYDKLWKRRFDWQKFIAVTSIAAGLVLAVGLATWFLWPKQLAVVSVEMSNDPVLDPDNRRNVIEVEFNNLLGSGLISEWQKKTVGPESAGKPTLQSSNSVITLLSPAINTTNHHRMVLRIAPQPETSLHEDVPYTLFLENAKDIWGNTLRKTNIDVKVVDKRGPSQIGPVTTASSELNDSIQFGFDEPLDKGNAENGGNYKIAGKSLTAQLQPDQRTVVLKADKPFESDLKYVLELTSNITDAAHAKNHLHDTNVNFTYAQIPLQLESVTAEDQSRIKVVFNRPIDQNSAKSAIQVQNLKVGPVNPLDNKSVELVLTNSYLTNGSYTLQISNLMDASGKAGNAFNTNASFSYGGRIEHEAPYILNNGVAATSDRLTLTFSKGLREETATRESNYTLLVKNGDQWQKVPMRFRAEISGASNIVVLNFPASLPDGNLKLQYSGVEDLVGNSTNDAREFVTGLNYAIMTRKAAQIVNNGSAIQFSLSGIIDPICQDKANFQLEDENGRAIRGVEIRSVTITPRKNTSDIYLELSNRFNENRFQVRYTHMRREGEAWEQTGTAQMAHY